MPIYVVECHEHGQQEVVRKTCVSVESAACPVCGADSPRKWVPVADQPFRSHWTEAFSTGPDPIHITSRKQEMDLCKKHGFERVN